MSLTSDMSQPTAPTCALGLTSADLSAWRDEALAPDETTRIGAHSEGCPACQERLEGFEAIAATLQAQQVPAPDERLWQAMLTALSAEQWTTSDDAIIGEYRVPDEPGDETPLTQSPTLPRSWRRRALGTLAAVAAIALVVVGFGQLFQFGASNRPPQPFSLTWRQVTLPGGMGKNLTEGTALSVFPADGSIAWLCQSGTKPTPGPLHIWRTSDGGATWRSVESPQLTQAFDCQIRLDQLNPDVAALDLDAFVHPPQSQAQHTTYITFDGGASWHDAPFFNLTTEFATLNGISYAIRQNYANFNNLDVSRDGLQTWTTLDNPLQSQKLEATWFWLNPNTGGLLVQAISRVGDGVTSLWTVDVSGNTWRSLTTPPTLANPIASPATDGHWNICSMLAGPNADPKQRNIYPYHIYCGTEADSQWTVRPALGFRSSPGGTFATPCSGCIQVPSTIGQTEQLAIASDGAVIVVFTDRFGTSGMPIGASLYRLPAGSSTWQNGGALPIGASTVGAGQVSSTVTYAPRPGGGMLWAMPDQDIGTRPAGPVFTASYPGPATPPLPTPSQQTPTPAGNVDQGAPLAWQPIANPTGFQPRLTSANILAVAPSDGRTAYACAQPNADPPATQPRGWATHDGGATWSTLPLPQVTGWCSLVVDEVGPRDVLLGFSHNPPAGGTTLPDLYYRSTDGGATWQRISGLDGSVVYQFATHGSAIYALRVTNPLSDTATAVLQASADGMATWHAVDGGLRSGQSGVGQFWLNPYNGELLATNVPPSTVTTTSSTVVWRSSDGGAHWSDLKAPAYGFTSVIVRPPQANHAWEICVSDFTASPTTAPSNLLYCGDDSSQGWHDMTGLDTGDATATPHYVALTSDGALLAITMATTGAGATTYNVYRLPSGANRWQTLGPTPEFSLLYAPTADGDGMLWSAPVNGIVGVPVNGISSDEQGRIFAAAAP